MVALTILRVISFLRITVWGSFIGAVLG